MYQVNKYYQTSFGFLKTKEDIEKTAPNPYAHKQDFHQKNSQEERKLKEKLQEERKLKEKLQERKKIKRKTSLPSIRKLDTLIPQERPPFQINYDKIKE